MGEHGQPGPECGEKEEFVIVHWMLYVRLKMQEFDRIRPETVYGDSRIDFYMEKGRRKYLLEVKGCTLEIGGVGYFPDAPTERGAKHLRELIRARGEGFRAALAFVIQTDGVTEVRPNRATDPRFADAMEAAARQGVRILFLPCHVEPDSIVVAEGGPAPM